MDKKTRNRLTAAGFRIGDAEDFLGLSEEGRVLKDRWRCREFTCAWLEHGKPFTVSVLGRVIDAQEAAECAAAELDSKDWGDDFDTWTVGNVNHQCRYVGIEVAEGKWKRFRVRVRCKVEYDAHPTEKETTR